MVDSPHVVLHQAAVPALDTVSVALYALALLLFAALTHRRPALAVAMYLLIVPFALPREVGHVTTMTLSKAALAGMCIGLLLRRPRLDALRDARIVRLAVALAVVVAVTALSIFQADYHMPVLRETLKAAEFLILFLIVVLCFVEEPQGGALIEAAVFVAAVVVSVLALSQEFTAAPAGIFIGRHAVPRIAGPLEGPNQLAAYLGLLLPLMLAFALSAQTRAWRWIAIAIVTCALVLTFSRAGFLSAMVAAAVVFAVGPKATKRTVYALAAGVVAGMAAVLLVGGEISYFWSTRSSGADSGLGTRGELWTAAFRLWRAHPLLGIGAGNYEFELGRVGYPELHTHANSAYIQALVEGGIPSFLALLWVTWLSIATFLRSRVRTPLVCGALGAASGLALHQIFDFLTFFTKVGQTFWVVMALGVAALCVAEPVAEIQEQHAVSA